MNPQTQDTRLIAKRTTNALDRLDAVEKVLPELVTGINNSLGSMNQQLNAQGEVLDALVGLLGRDTVETAIKTNRETKATEMMEAEKKAYEELKVAGALSVVEKVTEKSIVVGREYNPDGTVRHPGRAQVAFQRVDAAFKDALLGQPAGFILELPNGGKFEVVEVAEVVQPPDPQAPEQNAPAAEAQQ